MGDEYASNNARIAAQASVIKVDDSLVKKEQKSAVIDNNVESDYDKRTKAILAKYDAAQRVLRLPTSTDKANIPSASLQPNTTPCDRTGSK